MQVVIDIDEEQWDWLRNGFPDEDDGEYAIKAIANGIPLPQGHGRLGDLDELEQRISNFVEHDAHITDEYTVTRQRFIVDGIRQTVAIIKADKEDKE